VRARCLHERGDLAEARRAYEVALAGLQAVGFLRYAAAMRANIAAFDAAEARINEAEQGLERAEAEIRADGDQVLLECVRLACAHVDLAHARQAEDASARRKHVALARKRLMRSAKMRLASEDLRFEQRLVERALAEVSEGDGGANVLSAEENALWFQAPSGRRIALGTRPNLQLLLRALLEQRLRAPGEPLAVEVLFERSWPGEQILQQSAAMRVWGAVKTLRNMGLRDVLVRRGGGYLLDPAVDVVVVRSSLGEVR
jgi:hypothetical protein